jgi:oxygen-dependent protoporphyrinogen oxidase
MSVLIVGGGITGLTTAHRLLEAQPDLDVRLLEASPRLGGPMGTEVVDGFVFERGPNGFLDNVPQTLALARALGLGDRLLASAPTAKNRYVLRKGRLHALPTSPLKLLTSPLLSIGGRLRTLCEPFMSRGRPHVDDSVASFGRRRLGVEATSTFLDPLVTGIYAGDVERVSLQAAFPRLAALEREHGSLIKGMVAKARARRRAVGSASSAAPGPTGGTLYSLDAGLEELVQALVHRLGDRVQADAAVEVVRPKGGKNQEYEVVLRDQTVLESPVVVAALPAPRAANLFSSWNHDLANALGEIPYAPVAVVCLGYKRSDVVNPLDGFGFLIPRDQGLRTLGVIWVSSIFPRHAPSQTVSLRILVGGARDPDVVGRSAERLTDLVLGEIGPVLGLQGEPVARRVYRYTQGIPQYNVGHSKRLRRIDGWLRRSPGLFLTGNAYRGVGINDCVAEAERVAGDVLAYLEPSQETSAEPQGKRRS